MAVDEKTERLCGMCGLAISEGEVALRTFGYSVAHNENRCVALLQRRVAHLEDHVRHVLMCADSIDCEDCIEARRDVS